MTELHTARTKAAKFPEARPYITTTLSHSHPFSDVSICTMGFVLFTLLHSYLQHCVPSGHRYVTHPTPSRPRWRASDGVEYPTSSMSVWWPAAQYKVVSSTFLSTNSPPPQDLTPYIAKADDDQYVAGGGFGDVYRCWYHCGSPKEVRVWYDSCSLLLTSPLGCCKGVPIQVFD